MSDPAWDMLRKMAKPDKKGRFKTLDAMKVAKVLYKENEGLREIIDDLIKRLRRYERVG